MTLLDTRLSEIYGNTPLPPPSDYNKQHYFLIGLLPEPDPEFLIPGQ